MVVHERFPWGAARGGGGGDLGLRQALEGTAARGGEGGGGGGGGWGCLGLARLPTNRR